MQHYANIMHIVYNLINFTDFYTLVEAVGNQEDMGIISLLLYRCQNTQNYILITSFLVQSCTLSPAFWPLNLATSYMHSRNNLQCHTVV